MDPYPHTFEDGVRQVASGDQVQANFDAVKAAVDALEALFPAGVVMEYVGRTAPSGWLLADGSAVTTSHSALRDMLLAAGSPFGVSGSDPKLPDLRGRTAIGAGTGAGLTARTLGDLIGAETHRLTEAELATHTHGASTNSTGAHTHSLSPGVITVGTNPAFTNSLQGIGSGLTQTGSAGSHSHTVTVNNAGSGSAHNNMPPSVALNYIVKT